MRKNPLFFLAWMCGGRPVAYYRVLDERIRAAGFFFGSLIGVRGA